MILHLVKQSPYASYSLQQCCQKLADDDGLLLMQDAVLALTMDNPCLASLATRQALFALSADCLARGLKSHTSPCTLLDYPDFVELTLKYDKVISW